MSDSMGSDRRPATCCWRHPITYTGASAIAFDHLPLKAAIDVATPPSAERRRVAPPPGLLGTPAE